MQKIVMILVHGYNVSDPGQTVGKLRPYFKDRGFEVDTVDYYHTNLMQVRSRNPLVAQRLSQCIVDWHIMGYKVGVIGHSNGAAIIHLASKLRFETEISPNRIFLVNPALKKDIIPWPAVRTTVFHSTEDNPVMWSRWLSKIVPRSWFDARPWGEMGRTGFKGLKVGNIDNYRVNVKDNRGYYSDHSGMFHSEECLSFYSRFMANGMKDIKS